MLNMAAPKTKCGMTSDWPPKETATEAEKHLEYSVNFKVALEYKLLTKLTLRTGVATATEQFSFGTGFQAKQLQFDYGFGRQTVLGNLHQLAISFRWK